VLSTTLAAQTPKSDSTIKVPSRNAIGFGYFATLGSYWQIEAIEFGYVRKLTRGLAAVSLTARLGTFIDETAVSGGSRGIAFVPTLGFRTHMKRIAQLGEDGRGTAIGLDITVETSAYRVRLAVLAGLAVGCGRAPAGLADRQSGDCDRAHGILRWKDAGRAWAVGLPW
jgi:hypothetical protein